MQASDDCVRIIFKFLDFEELCCVSLTCKKYYEMSQKIMLEKAKEYTDGYFTSKEKEILLKKGNDIKILFQEKKDIIRISLMIEIYLLCKGLDFNSNDTEKMLKNRIVKSGDFKREKAEFMKNYKKKEQEAFREDVMLISNQANTSHTLSFYIYVLQNYDIVDAIMMMTMD